MASDIESSYPENSLTSVPPVSLDNCAGTEDQEKAHSADADASGHHNTIPMIESSIYWNFHKVQRLLHTSAGQDSALACVEYLSHALHNLLASHHWQKWSHLLQCLFHYRKTDIYLYCKNPSCGGVKQSCGLLKLSALIGDTRQTVRLFGLLSLVTNLSTLLKFPRKNRFIFYVSIMQMLSITSYQFLENIGHLMSRGIISLKIIGFSNRPPKLFAWSARSLFLYIFLEVMKLTKEASSNNKSTNDERLHSNSVLESTDGVLNDHKEKLDPYWGQRMFSSLIWGSLCLYWGSGQNIALMEKTSGALSFLAELSNLRNNWRQSTPEA